MGPSARPVIPISNVVIGDDEIDAVVEVLRSGNLREGPVCQLFEEEFARYTGARIALAVSSGTAALHMAYLALLQQGDEVLVPSFTFFATASMIVAAGAVPVFCDINPETLTIDVEDAARRVTPRTRAIAPVHIFGNPADVDAVLELADRHGLKIIWDAAQAHDTRWEGRDVGSFGDAVCYSFYPSKNMTTGEGGMICLVSDALAEKLRLLRSQGQTGRYAHDIVGYNFRMTDVQAAIGRGQLRHLRSWIERRRANADYLRERFASTPELRVQSEQPGGFHSYHQLSVLVDGRVDRDAMVSSLAESGVGCGVYYPIPQHRQRAFVGCTGVLPSLPVTEDVCRRILSIPVHPYLSREDLAYVAEATLAAVAANKRPDAGEELMPSGGAHQG